MRGSASGHIDSSSTDRRLAAAFTLVELMVVVAIVALLIALLTPALRQARYTARLAVCGTTLRQVGTAVHVYTTDNFFAFPYRKVLSESGNPRPTNLRFYSHDDRPMMRRLLPSLDFLICPFSPLDRPDTLETSTRPHIHSSYEMWFGGAIDLKKPESHFQRVTTPPQWNGRTFRVMAADMEWEYRIISQWQSAHPDDDGLLALEQRNGHLASQNNTHTMTHWWNTINSRGDSDRNFLYFDGSVRTMYDLSMYDDRLVQVPYNSAAPAAAIYGYLPAD